MPLQGLLVNTSFRRSERSSRRSSGCGWSTNRHPSPLRKKLSRTRRCSPNCGFSGTVNLLPRMSGAAINYKICSEQMREISISMLFSAIWLKLLKENTNIPICMYFLLCFIAFKSSTLGPFNPSCKPLKNCM